MLRDNILSRNKENLSENDKARGRRISKDTSTSGELFSGKFSNCSKKSCRAAGLIKQIVLIFFLMNLALTIQMSIAVAAEGTQPAFGPLTMIQQIGKDSNLPDFYSTGQHPEAPSDALQKGVGAISSPFYFAFDLIKYVMSTIAIIIIVIQAIQLISTASDEEATAAKKTLTMGLLGLIIIQLADVIVKQMFFGDQGQAFEDIASAEMFAKDSVSQLRGIIGFVQVLIGAGAMLVIVVRGFILMTSAGNEESMTKATKHILYALVGLGIVVLSEVIVRGVIFPEAGEKLPDVEVGKFLIVQLTNYAAGFVAIFAFLGLFYGGYRYVMAGTGEEGGEKVKKIILGSVIALGLALGAYAIVNTIFQIEPSETNKPVAIETNLQEYDKKSIIS